MTPDTTDPMVVLVGGFHDGHRMPIPDDVTEIELPVMADVTDFVEPPFSHALTRERYRRIHAFGGISFMASASLDEQQAVKMLICGYQDRGQVKLGVVDISEPPPQLLIASQR